MNARWIIITGFAVAVGACGADTTEEEPADTAAQPAETTEQQMDAAAQQSPETPAVAMEPRSPTGEDAAAREPAAERAAGAAAAAMNDPAATGAYDELYTVQIAAYLTPQKAQALAEQLRGRGLPIWTVDARVEGRDWIRVRIGASPDLGEARELGRWITRSYNSPVWVAPVDEDAEPVPAGAVEETRRFMIQL